MKRPGPAIGRRHASSSPSSALSPLALQTQDAHRSRRSVLTLRAILPPDTGSLRVDLQSPSPTTRSRCWQPLDPRVIQSLAQPRRVVRPTSPPSSPSASQSTTLAGARNAPPPVEARRAPSRQRSRTRPGPHRGSPLPPRRDPRSRSSHPSTHERLTDAVLRSLGATPPRAVGNPGIRTNAPKPPGRALCNWWPACIRGWRALSLAR